jgi:hypothetical protein
LSGGTFTTLMSPSRAVVFVRGINNLRQIVGYDSGSLAFSSTHGFFLASPTGQATPVNFPGPDAQGTGVGSINDSGTIAGQYNSPGGVTHGFIAVPVQTGQPVGANTNASLAKSTTSSASDRGNVTKPALSGISQPVAFSSEETALYCSISGGPCGFRFRCCPGLTCVFVGLGRARCYKNPSSAGATGTCAATR